MITDSQTNFVYLSDKLQINYPAFATRLFSAFTENNIPFGILPGTKDVWAVDYMPVQVSENKFVRFTYSPDYLISTKKWSKTISDVDAICEKIGIKTIKSDIVLDGGNITRWSDKVIMTTKVFLENPSYPEIQLIQALKDILEVNDIFFVPLEKGDWLGHIDATARFISSDVVLINDPKLEKQSDYINLLTSLHNSSLKWKFFPFNPYNNSDINDASGIYLNYLELSDFIALPVYGFDTDEQAIDRAQEIFPTKKIIPVLSNEPAKHNGIINCVTWNICLL